MTLTAEQRGDLAESLLPVAARLACITHGDGGVEDIAKLLDGFDAQELTALVVVLAGLVNPSARVADSLAYLTWDEHGYDATPVIAKGTIRGLAPYDEVVTINDPRVTGHRMYRRGMTVEEIAARVEVTERTVHRWVATWRKQGAAA